MNASSSLRRDARLAGLAGDVDLDQDLQARARVARGGARARAARTREATEWISRTCGTIARTRRLCSWPMKSHSNSSPCGRDLRLRDPARGSRRPARRRPAPAPAGPARDTYLVAASTSTSPALARPRAGGAPPRDLLAHPREVRADPLGAQVGDQLNHATPAWRPARAPSRRWEKKRSSQIVHAADVVAPRHARRQQPLARDRPQVDVPARARRVRAAERRVHLLADLVAAGPAPGPIDRDDRRPRRPAPASARTPSSSTPAARPRQPACTIATAPSRAERDRQAVGARAPSRPAAQRGRLAVGVDRGLRLAVRSAGVAARAARSCRGPGSRAPGAHAELLAQALACTPRHARRRRRRRSTGCRARAS